MKIYIFLLTLLVVFNVYAHDCVVQTPKLSPGGDTILNDLNIPEGEIKSVKIEQIEDMPVSKILANTLKNMVDINNVNNTRNIITKYTYVNKNDKENVFIANSLLNVNDCSTDFIGYLIVEQNF